MYFNCPETLFGRSYIFSSAAELINTLPQTSLLHKNILETLNQIIPSDEWELNGPVIEARESTIYQATLAPNRLIFAIKHYHPTTNLNAAQQQYQALEKYQHTLTERHDFRVPKVYAFDREQRLLIMEWAHGKSLHQHLWSGPQVCCSSKTILEKCGHWLRTFHDQTLLPNSNVNFMIYLNGIEKELSKLENKGLPIDALATEFRATYTVLTKMIQRYPELLDNQATLHGDFTPHNIIIGKNDTIGVDIWATAEKPVLLDLSRMLVYLTIAYPLLTLRKPVFEHNGKLNKTIIPLIEGYGRDAVDPQSIHFRIALLSEYLRRWLVIEGRRTTAINLFTDKFQTWQIRKNTRALIALMANS